MSLYNQLVHVGTHVTGLIFLDPTRAQSLRVATSRTRSAFVLSALPPAAAAASGTIAVFAFALKAVVQSTFIYRLRRTAALSVRLEYQPSLGFVHGTHSGFGMSHAVHDVRQCAQDGCSPKAEVAIYLFQLECGQGRQGKKIQKLRVC